MIDTLDNHDEAMADFLHSDLVANLRSFCKTSFWLVELLKLHKHKQTKLSSGLLVDSMYVLGAS